MHRAIDNVYFPMDGVASILAVGENGESWTPPCRAGRHDRSPVFLGTGPMPVRTMVQVPLRGYRLSAGDLRAELERGGKLVNLLLRYTQVVMVSMAQLILCNRAHRLDQRAARWLLQVDERVDEAPFDVTQVFRAETIGTQRPSISLAVSQFKDEGMISYSRGRISITDRDRLLQRSCACIGIIHEEEPQAPGHHRSLRHRQAAIPALRHISGALHVAGGQPAKGTLIAG